MRRGSTRFYYRQAFEYSKPSSSFFNAALAGNQRYLSCGAVLRVSSAQVSLPNVSFKKRCASGNPQAIGRQNLLGRQKTVLFDGVVKEPVIALFECLGPDRFVAGVVFRTKTGGFVFP